MERFEGRVAVVTGASSGIGAQIAEDLVRAGLVVVAVARRKERLESLASSLQGAKGRLHPCPADLRSVDDVRRVFQWVDDTLGGVAVLVNSAGVPSGGSIVETDVSRIISTNLIATAVCCQEALKSMQKHDIKDGHIININSIAGHLCFHFPGPLSVCTYSASKHGVTAFTKGLRFDIQKTPGLKTRVTSISPGGVNTDLLHDTYRKTHANRLLTPKDVSSTVMYALGCPPTVEITELTVQPVGEPL